MRIIVILKSNKYYICSRVYTNYASPYEAFELVHGGKLEVPRDNIEAIEKYNDTNTQVYRVRLKELQDNENYQSA